MPFRINDTSTSLEIVGQFPEIKKHYSGHGTTVEMEVMVTPASGNFLQMSASEGLVIGRESDIYVTLELTCSNPSQNISKELCLIFDIKTEFNMNMTIDDFNLFIQLGDITINSVQVNKDVIGMKNRDYQKVIQHIINYAVANYNYARYSIPYDLKPTSTWIPLLREVIKLKATPYI